MDTLTLLFIANILCATGDGISTRYTVKNYDFIEQSPVKYLIGESPTYNSMLPWGIVEVMCCTFVSKYLRENNFKYWYIPQLTMCSMHSIGFTVNCSHILKMN